MKKNSPRKFSTRRVALILALIAFGAVALIVFTQKPLRSTSTARPSGTTRMAERLEKIARESNPDINPFLNTRRAELFRQRLAGNLPAAAKVQTNIFLGLELLRAGTTTTAIEELADIATRLDGLPADERPATAWMLERFIALSYMRLGEQENCVAHHTSDSCLLPIRNTGVHEEQKGSRTAIDYFLKALRRNPRDLESIWLLNVAFMTLGEYPDQVPPQFLVPPKVFASDHDIRRFKDVATQAGLSARGPAGGVIMEDFDNDGLLDIVCSRWGLRDQLRYFHNDGNGGFTERTKEAGLEGLVGGLNIIQADYDNDGWRDILVLRGAWLRGAGAIPNSLLHNNGDGTFSDVTEAAGLLSFHPTQAAAWADFDGDGRLDLFIGNESDETNRHPCELYHNNGDGTFTECAAACGVALTRFVKGAVWGDYDNDGRPDLYLSCFGQPNVLLRNAGPAGAAAGKSFAWKFEDVTAKAGVAEPIDSFACWFWDYDNDGRLDLFVDSYSWQSSMDKVAADYLGLPTAGEKPRLYHNNGDGTFTDVTKATRLDHIIVGMGANFGDLDNDGWPDFYIGTGEPNLGALMPNRMFRNAGGKFFQDVTTSGGFGHVQKGHAIAFGDIDNDGDQDVYAVLGGAYEGDVFQNALFENPGHGNHWLTLRLRGVKSNRDAIGARIEVRIAEGNSSRSIFSTVSSGGSFGASSLQSEMGLGQATAVQSVTIQWPDGAKTAQVFTNVPWDSFVNLQEGRVTIEVVSPKRFKLEGGTAAAAGR